MIFPQISIRCRALICFCVLPLLAACSGSEYSAEIDYDQESCVIFGVDAKGVRRLDTTFYWGEKTVGYYDGKSDTRTSLDKLSRIEADCRKNRTAVWIVYNKGPRYPVATMSDQEWTKLKAELNAHGVSVIENRS